MQARDLKSLLGFDERLALGKGKPSHNRQRVVRSIGLAMGPRPFKSRKLIQFFRVNSFKHNFNTAAKNLSGTSLYV